MADVPFSAYEDFTFVVNGKNYKTTKIVADLLSNTICKIHSTDPTFDEFVITTKGDGDFSEILKLINFDKHAITKTEMPFIIEVLEQIGSKYINIFDEDLEAIDAETVVERFQNHLKNPNLFSNYVNKETNYISSNFFYMIQNNEEKLNTMTINEFEQIFRNPKLQLESEDQLLKFVNKLYTNDPIYSDLFKYVQFKNVSSDAMEEFFKLFDRNDLTGGVWNALSVRLLSDVSDGEEDENSRYYKLLDFKYEKSSQFNGILNYIRSKMPNNVFKEINITSSSVYQGNEKYSPQNVIFYENPNVEFATQNNDDEWLCFDFMNRQVIPNCYLIRSCCFDKNGSHPKSWVIEGSNDNKSWDILSKQENNSSLNGKSLIKKFDIQNPNSKKYRFIRMRQTKCWLNDCNFLNINSFEIFGNLV